MSVSLMVHAGGRWRAVPAAVAGRGAVCVARRGKLLALRHLRPDKLTLGPALPYKYRRPKSASSDSDVSAEPSRTKHKSKRRANIEKASVAVQCEVECDSSGGGVPRRGSKRKRSSSSEAPPPQPRTLTTLATVHADIHQEPKRHKIEARQLKRKRRSTSSDDLPLKASPKRSLSLKRRLGPSKRTSPSKEHIPIVPSRDISNRTNKLNRIQYNQREQHKHILKCKDATSSYEITSQRRDRQIMRLVISTDESDFETVKIKKQKSKSSNADKAVKHKLCPNKTQDRSSTDQPIKLAATRAIDRSSTDEATTLRHKKAASIDEPVKRKLQPKRTVDHSRKEQAQISPKKSIDRSSTDEPLVVRKLPTRAKDRTTKEPDPKKVIKSHNSATIEESQTNYRELVIDERDVEIIRLYLQKHHSDEELQRFDTDNEYKTMYFFRINPLVNVERCPRIARMIRSARQRRLLHFASKLGLRSVSEASPTKRYRTRRREEKNDVLDSSDVEDKENIDKRAPISRTVESGKVLRETLNKGLNRAREKKERVETKEREKDGTMETVVLSSANESDYEKYAERKKDKKPQSTKPKVMKPKVISSKRAGCKEYSNLEDHAIVAWVSTGARANCVNGNRLWRQLQEQYPRLTGHGRTWHSLRNRYLRYILPRLAALALPHAQQARLRAAAATGELKARKKESRRNSMFPLPARGASSRRPRPFAVTSHAERDGEPPEDDADGERSPRYSALTRQFARAQAERSVGRSTERSSAREPSRTEHSSLTSTRNNDFNNIRKPKRASPNRRNSPHAPNRRTRDGQSPSPRRPNSRRSSDTTRNNSRRSTRRKTSESTTGIDSSEESSERRSPRHTSTRRNSPQHRNRRKSNRRNSPVETNRRRSNRRNSPTYSNGNTSNRPNFDEPYGTTDRHNSPIETNRRRSNRRNTSHEINRRRSNRRNSPIETNGRKSNRLPESSSDSSASRGEPVATRRRTLVRTTDTSSTRPLTNKHTNTTTSPSRPPRLRKLFNHKAVF